MYDNIYPDFLKSHFNQEICEDEFVGFLFKNEENLIYKKRKDYHKKFVSADKHDLYCNDKSINYKGKIYIILESPHIGEYFGYDLKKYSGGITNSRPANGQTGKYIDKYLTKILENFLTSNLNDRGIYSVIIINSIRKQCSLGVEDTKIYRDRMWLNYWFDYGECNFIRRIKKLMEFEDDVKLILNCCTEGSHYKIDQKNQKYIFDEETTKLPQYFFENEYNLKKAKKDEEGVKLKCRRHKNNGALTLKGIVEATLEEIVSEKIIKKNYLRSNHPSIWNRNKKVNNFNSKEEIIRFKFN